MNFNGTNINKKRWEFNYSNRLTLGNSVICYELFECQFQIQTKLIIYHRWL